MTTAQATTTLGLLSTLNEAVIEHDAEEHPKVGGLLDVADAVEAFAKHANANLRMLILSLPHIDDSRRVLRNVTRANLMAGDYKRQLNDHGFTFGGNADAELLRRAADLVATVMDYETLYEN